MPRAGDSGGGIVAALGGSPIPLSSMPFLSDPVSTATVEPAAPAAAHPARRDHRATFLVLGLILLAGCFLRVPDYVFAPANPAFHWLAPLHPTPKAQTFGFDEQLYRAYVSVLMLHGLSVYPEMSRHYLNKQRNLDSAILPPTRFSYIGAAYAWHLGSGAGPLKSLSASRACAACSFLR